LELAVPSLWTVEEVRGVEEAVRARVGEKVRGVRRVRVRFVPKEAPLPERFDEFIRGDVSARGSPEPEEENGNGNGCGHDHHDHDDHGHEHKKEK
jgi:hypothetical protein